MNFLDQIGYHNVVRSVYDEKMQTSEISQFNKKLVSHVDFTLSILRISKERITMHTGEINSSMQACMSAMHERITIPICIG